MKFRAGPGWGDYECGRSGACRDRLNWFARDRALSISALSIGAVVGVCISAAVIMLFLAIPLFYLPVNLPTGAALASIGLVGVFAGSMIIWSDRRGGPLALGWPFTLLRGRGGSKHLGGHQCAFRCRTTNVSNSRFAHRRRSRLDWIGWNRGRRA